MGWGGSGGGGGLESVKLALLNSKSIIKQAIYFGKALTWTAWHYDIYINKSILQLVSQFEFYAMDHMWQAGKLLSSICSF